MGVRVSVRLEGGPVVIALPSPHGRRGAVSRAGRLRIRIERHLYCTCKSTLGQCPVDTLLSWTQILRG